MKYFEYPNVTNQEQFINELLSWIERFNPTVEDFNMEYIRQSLKAQKKEDLILLTSNEAGVMIENYYSVYANSIVSYYNSEHIFDEEYTIQEKLEEVSKNLHINPNWLMAVMWHESGINPARQNKSGGASGLVQFMPATAKAL